MHLRQGFACLSFLAATLAATTLASAQTTWTGSVNTSWDQAGNWDSGVPTAGDDAIIPNVATLPSTYITNPTCNSLTIESGATLTLGGGFDLTVGGNLTISGTLDVTSSSSEIAVAGNWTNDGTFNNGSSTVELTSTGDLDGTSETTFHNLSVTGGVRTASTRFLANGDVEVSGATELAIGNLLHDIAGNWTSSSAGTTVTGLGTLVFMGDGLMTTGLVSVPNIDVASGTRSVNVSNVDGDVTVSAARSRSSTARRCRSAATPTSRPAARSGSRARSSGRRSSTSPAT